MKKLMSLICALLICSGMVTNGSRLIANQPMGEDQYTAQSAEAFPDSLANNEYDYYCCEPCAPVCGTSCGYELCYLGIGAVVIAGIAAIIIASSHGHHHH